MGMERGKGCGSVEGIKMQSIYCKCDITRAVVNSNTGMYEWYIIPENVYRPQTVQRQHT